MVVKKFPGLICAAHSMRPLETAASNQAGKPQRHRRRCKPNDSRDMLTVVVLWIGNRTELALLFRKPSLRLGFRNDNLVPASEFSGNECADKGQRKQGT